MLSVWEKRWNTLEMLLTALSKQYKNAAQNEPWMATMHTLVDCLHGFGRSQFHFFYEGFFKHKNLYSSMYYPKEHVMHATLDQVVYDMSLFQQAAGQRRKAHLRPTLEKADKLAQLAINLAVDNNLLKETGVVTYFDKSPRIRIIPYAPIALIAIPYTSIDLDQDLLAIPHEVGHYVYRHASGLSPQLHSLISMNPLILNWLEEIFCDIYGTLVAGPAIGLDFADLLFSDSYIDFVTDDGDHPVPAIRPYIYTAALKKLNFPHAATQLKTLWKQRLHQRHDPTNFLPYNCEEEASLPFAIEMIKSTTQHLLTYLSAQKGVVNTHYWSQDTNDLDTLYPAFTQWVNNLPPVAQYRLKEDGDNVGLQKNANGTLLNKRRKGDSQTWRDWFKTTVTEKKSPLTANAWLPIFTSGGWTTQGPDDDGEDGI